MPTSAILPATPGPRPWREALALAAWLLITAAWRRLTMPDEGRYAGVAREMLAGDPLLPTLNGLPFFHKPPLLYWLDMAAMRVFGVGEFAVRLGPALGAFALGMALFWHLRRWHGQAVARSGLLLLATMPFFFIGGQFVNHDMGVAGCITVAVLAAVRAFDDPARPRSLAWLLLAWLACGLGVLAKGLIGVVLPGLVVLPWLLAQRRWRDALALLHPAGLLVFALVALPWLWAMQARFPGFLDYFIVEQHFRRYAVAGFNNAQPPYFYLWVVPLCTLPWSLWLWPAWRRAVAAAWRDRDERVALYLWWAIAVIGFFSLPRSKLVGYVLPALAPWCALLALVLQAQGRRVRRVAVLAALGCVALVAAIAWQAPKSQRDAGLALAARVQPGDRVVFVDAFPYDVPFYADLRAPVTVLLDWDDPAIPRRDDWRKELLDAARFATPAQRRVLWPRAQVEALLCGRGTVWFLAPASSAPVAEALPGAVLDWSGRISRLWRVPGRPCPAGSGP